MSGSSNTSLKTTLQFSVYLYVLSAGVRMFVAEMTESFKGISDKILKGSLPAIDCAATYGFDAAGGNSVLFGFVFGALGKFLAVGRTDPVPFTRADHPGLRAGCSSITPQSVCFANRFGGFRALAILCFCSGLIQVFGGAFAAGAFGLAEFGGWHGNLDQDILWPPIGWAMQHMGLVVIPATILAMLIIPQVQYARNKKEYFKHAEVM